MTKQCLHPVMHTSITVYSHSKTIQSRKSYITNISQ